MPDPIYETKDGQKVTKKQLLDSGYTEERISKGSENGILKLIGDTDLPDQSYKTTDGQIVTTKELLESGYSQDRINNGVYNGILMPETTIITGGQLKKKVGSISYEHIPYTSEVQLQSEKRFKDITDIKSAVELSKRQKPIVSGGTGGAAVGFVTDEDAVSESKKIKENLVSSGYTEEDIQGIYESFKDFPEDAKNVNYEQLLKERKENPLGFQRSLSAYKWQTPLFNAIRKKDKENATAKINTLISKQSAGSYIDKRLDTKNILSAVDEYIDDPDQKKKIIQEITNDRAIGYGITDESQWQSIQDDPRYIGKGGPLNNYQVLAIQFMEDTDPKKAELYNRYIKGKPKGLWGEEDLVLGYEQKTKFLEDMGMSLQAKALEEEMSDLIAKKNKGEISEQDIAAYEKLYSQYESLQKDAEAQKQRFPATSAMEADRLMQEATGQRNSPFKRFLFGVGENVGDVVNFFADATEAPFQSGEDKIISDLEDLGTKEFTKTYQRYRTQANQLVQDDGKINFTAPAIFNTISDVGSEIVSNISLSALTGGANAASKMKRLASLFGTVFSTTYNDYYTQAIKEDVPNPSTYATIHTAIEAATELINPDLQAVKKLVNQSSTFGKILKNVTQEQWDDILKSSRGSFSNILTGLKETGIAAGKNAFQETFEEVVGQLGGNVADASLFNQDVDLMDGMKSTIVNTLVGTLPMGFLGLPGQVAQLNRQQKYALYEVAQNKEKYLPKLEADVKNGVLTPEKAEQIKTIIENASSSLSELSAKNTININQADNEKTDILAEQYEPQQVTEGVAETNKNDVNLQADAAAVENIPATENKGAKDSTRPTIEEGPEKERKLSERYQRITSEADLSNPYDTALKYFADGGKIRPSELERIFGGKGDKAARVGLMKNDAGTVKQIAHALWESDKTGRYSDTDYIDAIESALRDYPSKAAMQKDLVERYDWEAAQEKYYEQAYGKDAIDIVDKMSDDEINHILELDADQSKQSEIEAYLDSIYPSEAAKSIEPPIPPTEAKKADEEGGKNKSFANRIVGAKNTPEASREGIRAAGLKYEPQSHQEAQELAKVILDEGGMDEAVLQAQAGKFGGDVNTLVQTEALNRLKDMEDAAKTPEEKLAYAKNFAEIAINLDESLRKQGRGISAVNFFYKKSPLGVQMMENTKRKEDFEQWAKPKDQSWKEFFDEMVKEPEFEAIIKEQVKEELKKERAASRVARTKKVHDAIDKAKDEFKGGAAYSTIIPPQVIMAALDGIKKAYDAGEVVVELVQDAIDFISDQLGDAPWDKEKFRKEWEEKLKEPSSKKRLTDEEVKTRILNKFRHKLKGLTDKEKEEVVKKSFEKIVQSGGLDYDDFKKIISDITGRGEMTNEEARQLKELVKKINSVEDAAKKAQEERTPEALKRFKETQFEAGKASKDLSKLLNNKPNIIKRLTSIMQLNTLGIPALVNNPIYNIWNQATLRFPIGIINTAIDKAVTLAAKVIGKKYNVETDIFRSQGEFFNKLGLGTKEAVQQFATGLDRQDYIQKEIHGQQIRPMSSLKDLWDYSKGKKKLTGKQIIDKSIQASPIGWIAEGIARTLNLGDKPQRFAAEGSQAAAFSKTLGLKDVDYKLFIEFPREEAYRAYKKKGLSDAEAGKKADYIRDTIIREGQRSTFQQDNLLNDILNKVFGGEQSGVGSFVKAVTVSPFIKIPANAYWSYYNLVNPEVALLQSLWYGANAVKNRGKSDNTAAKQLHEARYWFAHAAVGMAMRAVVTAMVAAGIYRSSDDDDDTKKEREGEKAYEQQGSMNITKLAAWLRGEDPDKVKGGVMVQNRWFGQWGSVGNTIAKRHENMTPEQMQNDNDYFDMVLGNLELSSLKELEQGVFANTSALLTALNRGGSGAQRWGVNTSNMLTNIVHPAAFAQISRAQLPYQTQAKADNFLGELKNSMLQRSSVLRNITGQMPPARVSVWGDKLTNSSDVALRLFGISNTNKDAFARPIYDDLIRTNDIGFLPPAVLPVLGDKKLNVEQLHKLEEYVGQARKNYIAPFINDEAEIEGFNVKYSQLPDEDKKFVLSYLYGLGKDDGVKKFVEYYPEFQKEETEVNYMQDIQRDLFKILQKYQTNKERKTRKQRIAERKERKESEKSNQ